MIMTLGCIVSYYHHYHDVFPVSKKQCFMDGVAEGLHLSNIRLAEKKADKQEILDCVTQAKLIICLHGQFATVSTQFADLGQMQSREILQICVFC